MLHYRAVFRTIWHTDCAVFVPPFSGAVLPAWHRFSLPPQKTPLLGQDLGLAYLQCEGLFLGMSAPS